MKLNWDDIRFFLCVARLGNLSAAAKELGVSQPTVGRRLAALEASLGAKLLRNTPDGYVQTLAGAEVRGQAERLETEAHSLERTVGGRDARLAGVVQVTCPEAIATHVLAPCFAALKHEHPDITVELILDARALGPPMREAELSVRLSQPTQHNLVIRRIGGLAFGLYASPGYLQRYGDPDFGDGCLGHRLILQLDDIQDAPQFRWLADLAPHAQVAFRTRSHEVAVTAALQGLGLACLACFRADGREGLVRLKPPQVVPSAGIWLVVHKESRSTPRIRAVMASIGEHVRGRREVLEPIGFSTGRPPRGGSVPAEAGAPADF